MGYTTDFEGSVTIEPPLNKHEVSFLEDLNQSRRMNRTRGPLFVKGSDGTFGAGQGHDGDIINYNDPDPDQPGLWCQWMPLEDGSGIEWDGGEKFYNSAEWMAYLVKNLLAPSAVSYIAAHADEDERLRFFTCDHVVNGTIQAQGEDNEDRWDLVVTDNKTTVVGYEFTAIQSDPQEV